VKQPFHFPEKDMRFPSFAFFAKDGILPLNLRELYFVPVVEAAECTASFAVEL
jgi:hypothetical protein